MKKSYVVDMTKGNETRHVIKFAVPMMIGNIIQQLYNIVDSIIVGRYVGDYAIAGVGSVSPLTFLFFSMCTGISLGVGVIVSHAFGEGDEDKVKKVIGNSIYLIVGAGMVMSILGIVFAEQILTFMKIPAETMPHALPYMRIICGGTVFVAGYNGVSSILRSLGDAKTPLIFVSIAGVLNIVLDLLFVVGFGIGAAGVALATVISQVIAMVGSILFSLKRNPYIRLKKQHLRIDRRILGQCSKMGIPVGCQFSLIAFSSVVVQGFVNSFGATVMAAYAITRWIEMVIQQPFNSMGAAISTFTGQNLAVGNVKRVTRVFKKGLIIVISFSLLALIVLLIAGEFIIGIFLENPEIISLGARAIIITAIFYGALGTIFVTRGVLSGAGDARFAVISGAIEVCSRIGLSVMLTRISFIGAWGLWATIGISWAFTGTAGLIRYFKGGWKNIEI